MNCYQFFSSEINLRSQERLSLQIRLRKGLDSNELVVHYQPQVDSITGRVVGVEALVRWSDPEKGVIAPDQFIPLAEETGLIHEIGEFVLRAALGQARKWRKERLPPYPGTLFLQAAAAGKPAVFHPRPREMRPAQRRERNE
jgi:EAL domain-containing protein (putative c-di-GMP-specific phosphodiesterase class I)